MDRVLMLLSPFLSVTTSALEAIAFFSIILVLGKIMQNLQI